MLDTGKDASLMFKITHKVAYKNVLKGTLTSIFLTNKHRPCPFLLIKKELQARSHGRFLKKKRKGTKKQTKNYKKGGPATSH